MSSVYIAKRIQFLFLTRNFMLLHIAKSWKVLFRFGILYFVSKKKVLNSINAQKIKNWWNHPSLHLQHKTHLKSVWKKTGELLKNFIFYRIQTLQKDRLQGQMNLKNYLQEFGYQAKIQTVWISTNSLKVLKKEPKTKIWTILVIWIECLEFGTIFKGLFMLELRSEKCILFQIFRESTSILSFS